LAGPLIGKRRWRPPESTAATRSRTAAPREGNDQVRIEATIATLDPELKIIAPVREWQMGREEEIAYAREHASREGRNRVSPYSIDDNLWGRSSEGRAIEDLGEPPPDDVFQLVTRPEDAPGRTAGGLDRISSGRSLTRR